MKISGGGFTGAAVARAVRLLGGGSNHPP